MDPYTACEQAYKNGYKRGREDSISWTWEEHDDGTCYCPVCQTAAPKWDDRSALRYCVYCGARLKFAKNN